MTTFRKFAVIYLIASLLSACGGSPPEETLSEEEIVLTFSVGTMVASLFETQTALVTPTPASTNTPLPTNTFLPTPTAFNTALPLATWTPAPIFYSPTPNLALIPTVTGTPPTATSNAGALAFGCNNAAFVRDANYPPGTTVSPAKDLSKRGRLKITVPANGRTTTLLPSSRTNILIRRGAGWEEMSQWEPGLRSRSL